MKSIMQEGSSVIKAVEKAWEAAGKPREFSIKVFEEQQKNFLGLTTKSAKIAIFFDGKIIDPEKVRALTRAPEALKKREQRRKEKEVEAKPVEAPHKKEQLTPQQGVIWSDQMIKFTEQWLQETLNTMGLSDVSFSLVPDHYQLQIAFSAPLHDDEEKERSLFRNFSLFMIQALRHKFHRPMRGFYIVFGRS